MCPLCTHIICIHIYLYIERPIYLQILLILTNPYHSLMARQNRNHMSLACTLFWTLCSFLSLSRTVTFKCHKAPSIHLFSRLNKDYVFLSALNSILNKKQMQTFRIINITLFKNFFLFYFYSVAAYFPWKCHLHCLVKSRKRFLNLSVASCPLSSSHFYNGWFFLSLKSKHSKLSNVNIRLNYISIG